MFPVMYMRYAAATFESCQMTIMRQAMWHIVLLPLLLMPAWGMHPYQGVYHYVHEHNNTYHTRFENIDLDIILASRRLVNNYIACLMDTKPCTAEGDELKRVLPEAVQTQCAKCSEKQKDGAKKVITTLQTKYPEQWKALRKKWNVDKLKTVL